MRAEKRNKDTKNEVKISSRVFVYLCLAGLAIAVVTGWLMFVQGFFPLRVRADGMDTNKPRTKSEKKATETMQPAFDKLVFVVFDALRSDFITDPSSEVC